MINAAIQHWQLAYLGVAVMVGVASIVAADHLQAGNRPATSTQCAAALIAGTFWPVVAVGLAQLWALQAVTRRLRGPQAPLGVCPVHRPVSEPELVAAGPNL